MPSARPKLPRETLRRKLRHNMSTLRNSDFQKTEKDRQRLSTLLADVNKDKQEDDESTWTPESVFGKVLSDPDGFEAVVGHMETAICLENTKDGGLIQRLVTGAKEWWAYLVEHKWEVLEWALKVLPILLMFMAKETDHELD